jgi:hypothetical protein
LPFPAALTIEGTSCMFVILSHVWIYNQVKLVLLFILIIITCFMKRKFKQWWSAIPQITGIMNYLRYLCLFGYSGVQHILCCVFVLLFFVMCTQFLWIVHFWLPLRCCWFQSGVCVKFIGNFIRTTRIHFQ